MNTHYVIVSIYTDIIDKPLKYIIICEGVYDMYDLRSCYKEQLENLTKSLKSDGLKWASLNVTSPQKIENNTIKI